MILIRINAFAIHNRKAQSLVRVWEQSSWCHFARRNVSGKQTASWVTCRYATNLFLVRGPTPAEPGGVGRSFREGSTSPEESASGEAR